MTRAKKASKLEEIKTFVDKETKRTLEKIFEENYPQKNFKQALALFLRDAISRKVAETQEELEVLLGSDAEEPLADAQALPEDQKDFFELAAPALEAGILDPVDPDYRLDFLNWNGNSTENILRARAQAMEITFGFNDPEFRRKVYRNILEATREQREELYFDPLTGWIQNV